jgi:hypothetical protein
MENKLINDTQNNFYKAMFDEHGYSVKSVGFVSEVYQDVRFEKLSNMFKNEDNITVHEIGFGLGHFYKYLKEKFPNKNIIYSGSEIMEDFYNQCKDLYPDINLYLRDIGTGNYEDKYDFIVLNGVFNPKCDISKKEWEKHILNLLAKSFSMAKKGVAFSILTEFCDYYDKELYYCNTAKFFNYINDNLSRFFHYDQGYPLFESTFHVYKEDYMKSLYVQPEFNKYFKK